MSALLHLRRFSREFLIRHWKAYVLGTIAVVVTNVMAVRIAAELAQALDALRADDVDTVRTVAVHIFILGAATVVVRTASRLWFFTPARHAEFDLRETLFGKLLRLQPDFYAKHTTGDLLSRATTDITFARAYAGFATLQGANVLAALVATLGQMSAFSPGLTLYAAVPITIGFVAVQRGSASLMDLQRETQRQQGLYADQLLGALSGIATVQAFDVEGIFADRLGQRARQLRDNNVALARLRALVFPLFTVSGGLAIFVLLAIGGQRVVDGDLTAGELAAFVGLVTYLIMPLRLLGFLLPVFQRAEASLERIYSILDASEPTGQPGWVQQPGEIRLQSVSVRFGEQAALSGLSLTLKPGERVGVFGKSGSGKTTLLRVLAALQTVSEGQVQVAGRDLQGIGLPEWRRSSVFVPQNAWLFGETIAENVLLGLPEDRLRVLDKVAFAADLAALPDGVKTVVGERGIVLSGGQRQRVALARGLAVLAERPQVLCLFDDVLSAVDHHTEQALIPALLDHGATTVLVTHRMSALARCDRVIVLDGGKLVQSGTHAELLAQPGLYRAGWQAQGGT